LAKRAAVLRMMIGRSRREIRSEPSQAKVMPAKIMAAHA